MEWVLTHIWELIISLGLGFFAGFLIGKTLGLSEGKEAVIQKVKNLIVRGKVDFNIEELLRSELHARK